MLIGKANGPILGASISTIGHIAAVGVLYALCTSCLPVLQSLDAYNLPTMWIVFSALHSGRANFAVTLCECEISFILR